MKASPFGQLGLSIAMLIGLCVILTVYFQIGTVHYLEGWRWRFQTAASWNWGITTLWMGAAFTVVAVCFKMSQPHMRMLALVLLGLIVQWGPALSTGEGIVALEDRAISTGHREFSVIASHQLEFSVVLGQYEALASAPSQRFARSKPPGQLMGYMLFERLARILPLPRTLENPKIVSPNHGRLVRFLAIIMPFLASLSLILVYRLASAFMRSEQALGVAVAYALTPSFSLVQLHFDQAVYPLLCLGMWLLTVRASTQLWQGICLGGLIYLSVFVSFSLLPAVLLVPLLLWSLNQRPSDSWILGVGVGTVGMLLLGFLGGYLPWVRYAAAMAHHAAWKNWIWDPWLVAQFSLLNVVEWLWWIGGPLVIFTLTAGHGSDGEDRLSSQRVGWSLLIILVLLLAFGKTIGEVARLWCFLIPLGLIWSVGRMEDTSTFRLAVVVVLQLLLIGAFRYTQDFW